MLINYERTHDWNPYYKDNGTSGTTSMDTRQILMNYINLRTLRFMGGVVQPVPIEPSRDPARS